MAAPLSPRGVLEPASTPAGGHQPIPYANPFRKVRGITPERIDMGVDLQGTGPFYPIGPARITGINTSWAGGVGAVGPGTWITYVLKSGPLKGKQIYTAENVEPAAGLAVGQDVDASIPIGYLTGQGAGIETGFADYGGPGTLGETLAAATGQTPASGDPGGNTTAYGRAWSDVIHYLGGPAGLQGGPDSGSLPAGWWTGGGNLAPAPPGAPGGGPGGGGTTAVLTSSGQGGLTGILSGTGSILHGAATMLDWLFGFWYPGQGWRIAFGAGAVAAAWGGAAAWRNASEPDAGGGTLPAAVALFGAAALAGFIALRPWPQIGTKPIRPGAYVVETLEGAPPVAGQARPHDVTGIEIGLGVIAGAWLASKVAGLSQGILDFLAGLGAAGAASSGDLPAEPPVIPEAV